MAAIAKFDFIGKRNIAFLISGGSVVIFWIWVFISGGGLKYGIDFTGGIQHIFKFNRPTTADLLSQVREAALKADGSAQVQTLGKPEEGEVMIQVKGFELVEKITAEINRAPVADMADLKSRLAGFETLDTSFYEKIPVETGPINLERVRKAISDHVNTTTARNLEIRLMESFGAGAARIDLNKMPVAERLFKELQKAAVDRLAAAMLEKMPTARSIADLSSLLTSAGLDPAPFEGKFLLRTPALEDIQTDLREYAGQPERIAEVILQMYPNAYRDAFMPTAGRIVAEKEERGLLESVDDAIRLVEGPQADLLKEVIAKSCATSPFILIKTDQVSSRIGAELRQKALVVISLSLLTMLIYIWIRFEFRFAIGAVVTLLHDALTVIPLMSVLGYEYDINLIAAILTLIGYSLNDTIVVYDRIRENLAGMRGAALQDVINTSIVQTLSRTVVTGITTLLAVLSLFFLGGPVLEGFSLALFIGILVGTYSSIFVSSPVVYLWPVKK